MTTASTIDGRELKRRLRACDLSQKGFSALTGRSEVSVSAWCRDSVDIPPYAIAILTAFEIMDTEQRVQFSKKVIRK